ncbi:FAD-dependent monooxygenase [Streptomyces sp. AV19]|nr:FAD-dependent monooxygenase [Streptomyces sp. AV19]
MSVLVSGAGLAGPALAHWLRRHGFAPTVVERAPGIRPGGQAVDIRGVALEAVERMGLLERVRAARTRLRGMSVLDGAGNELHRSTEFVLSSGRLDGDDVEILREDLVRFLYELTADEAEYVHDDSITALEETETGVRVTFERGPAREFDLVIGADGLYSNVRRLAFGPHEEFLSHLGSHLAVFGADNFLRLEDWELVVRDEAIGYVVYPARENRELRVTFGFEAGPLGIDHRDTAAQRHLVAEWMERCGWQTAPMLKALADAPDFHFSAMAQVRMDRWSDGRVALLGDAGYCGTPLSGQGTSMALVGAYVLAEELGRADGDHAAGFAAYERRMRPFVTANQALATENPGAPASEESVERAKWAMELGVEGA